MRRDFEHFSVRRRIVVAFLLLAVVLALPVTSWARPATGTESASPRRLRAPVSDLGFKPKPDGFSFENYGSDSEPQNMTEADVRALFGDKACTMSSGGKLVLTPTARKWMNQVNSEMANGHCEGMAALSLMFYTGEEDVKDYGGDSVYGLEFDNADLQSEIARWWATQALDPTESSVIEATPTQILDVLAKKMSKDGETYTLGIYKRDGSDGHAITPYAVENDGNGQYRILVYDNNYPGKTCEVKLDANKNTWNYVASTNPDEEPETYEGDASTKTLELTPTSARTSAQSAPFALSTGGPIYATLGPLAATTERLNQLFLDGNGNLLISNEKGQRLGYVDGTLVNEIPGARYTRLKTGAGSTSPEPIYWTPEKMNLSVQIDGTGMSKESPTDLVMIGPGFATGVESIALEPGQKDSVIFDPRDQAVSYETDRSASPNLIIDVEEKGGVAYDFEIKGAKMQGGGTITALLDTKSKDLLLNTEKLKNEGSFNLHMTRISDQDEVELVADDIKLPAGAMIYMNYGDWKGPESTVQFGVDTNGDGKIDDVYEAEGTATSTSGGIPFYVWIIIALVVLAVALAVFLLLMRRRSTA